MNQVRAGYFKDQILAHFLRHGWKEHQFEKHWDELGLDTKMLLSMYEKLEKENSRYERAVMTFVWLVVILFLCLAGVLSFLAMA